MEAAIILFFVLLWVFRWHILSALAAPFRHARRRRQRRHSERIARENRRRLDEIEQRRRDDQLLRQREAARQLEEIKRKLDEL